MRAGRFLCVLMPLNFIVEPSMPLQIADPKVVATVERLAKRMGWTATLVVERALEGLLQKIEGEATAGRIAAILAQIDRLPDRIDACDPLQWDEQGLPK